VPRDLDAFLKSRLGSKGAYNLRRAERLLEGLGRLEFVVAGDEESRAAIVDAMIRHKRERCRAAGLRDNFDDPGYEAFYRTAPGRLGDLAQVSALFLDGRPVAEHWGLRDRDCLYYLMPAFEAGELEKYSVGSVLILRLLGLCASEGIARMDFAAGDEPYKERWCPERMPIYSLEAGLGFAGALISLSLRAVRSAKKGPVLAAGRRIKKALRGALRSIGSRS
jgi:CelD/BcsL family acetyltransferase involved in cellulose biosynthesis